MSKGAQARRANPPIADPQFVEDSADGDAISLAPVFARERTGYGAPFMVLAEHRRMVMIMSANGVPQQAIAEAMGCSDVTLQKYFREELTQGHERVKAHMGAALVQCGLSGSVSAQKFWLATRGGAEWRLPKGTLIEDGPDGDDEVVHFYIPSNHRDQPEDTLPADIEGEVASE